MPKVQQLTPDQLKVMLAKNLKRAKKFRERWEPSWRKHEQLVYTHNSRQQNAVTLTEDNLISFESDENGPVNEVDMAVNYAFKFLRFIHSQMSANPPSVIARPTSSDMEDALKADAADRVVRYAIAQEDIQEVQDQCNLKALTYCIGYIRVYYNYDEGDTYEFDETTNELTMGGKICVRSPSTWDIWLDPGARVSKDVRWFFERIEMTWDEAVFKWPDRKEELKKCLGTKVRSEADDINWRTDDETVVVYFYVEKGLPINGMAGRMAYCLEDGTILGEATRNTNPSQCLGLTWLTDIDMPDEVYGLSFLQYIAKLQELLNRLDTSFVDNIAAHNVVRMVLPDGAEIEDQSLSNSSWDYVKITGNSGNGPYFVPAAQLMPDAHRLRENLISGIQELAGVNDSMMGVQKREISGFSMQTAIDAGNQTRRRLFNKYTLCVRDMFKMYLANAVQYWDTPRTIAVLGREKAFESADLKGTDIEGGYDITCEYGASLSLDPARRREEIMQLMPIFEKAGIPTKTILSMLKLNALEDLYDRAQLASDRQREVFEQIIATEKQVNPREIEDHQGMLDFAYYYVMTSSYKYLRRDVKELIDQHIRTREQLAKDVALKGQPAQQPPPPPEAAMGMAPPSPPILAPAA